MKQFLIFLSIILLPASAWGYVPQDYPAVYTHQLSRAVFLVSLFALLHAMVHNRLHKLPGWRCMYYSIFVFMIWDMIVMAGRLGQLDIVGDTEGFKYLDQMIEVQGWNYFFVIARMDQLLLDVAMALFYWGLRTHLKVEDKKGVSTVAFVPILPILFSDIVGTILFIILAALSLVTTYRLFFRDKDNPLWSYMVYLSWSHFIYSISRSFGHIARHGLIAMDRADLWSILEPLSGSFNTAAILGMGGVTLFFVRAYQLHLKMAEQRREIERINTTLTELNEDIGTLVAERTMALMGLTVADRVRNPAFFMGGACRRLIEKGQVAGNAEETVRDMAEECKKLEAIVDQFEAFFKAKRGMFKFEDLKAVISSVVDAMGHESKERRIKMKVVLPEEDLPINMQKNLIKAAFFHVLRNSLESTPPGGTITISAKKENEHIIVTVADNGKGIPAEVIRQIFDPFFSTKQYGFGMGLPLVRQIVTEHMGEIKVESDPEKGTTVRMYFPVRWDERTLAG
jgi:signal transduction histidine kinase